MQEAYKITGMTCAACSARIEKVLGKMEGVESVSVNLATEKMTIESDDTFTQNDIIEKVKKIGYQAELIDTSKKRENADADKVKKEKALRVLKTKLIISAIFAAPLLYIAMAHMIKIFKLPLPAAIDPM
ncbi:MAG: cation transporter, partial [Anaerovoracaceae bacterium]